jgi:hypothetical protein
MADMEFGYGLDRQYIPIYDGINWEEAWINKHETQQRPVWCQLEDDLGKLAMQLHQENCVFFINDTNSDFDCLMIHDPRDDGDFYMTRMEMGEEPFDNLFQKLNDEVMTVFTKYPANHVAEFILKHLLEED